MRRCPPPRRRRPVEREEGAPAWTRVDPPRPVESEEGGAGMDPPARGGRREEGAPPLALGGGGRRGRCRRPMEEAGGTREEGATDSFSAFVFAFCWNGVFFYALQEVGLAAETAHFACSHPQLAGNSLRN